MVIFEVRNNQLTTLPAEVGYMRQLTKLDISYNRIIELPLDLHYLSNLTVLDLKDNPLVLPPNNIVTRGTAAVLEYLADQADAKNKSKSKKK